jgi:O-antigen ligase
VFVFSWAAAVATVGRDDRLLDTFCRAWAYSAAGWAAVLIFGEIAGIDWLSGISSRDGIRASFTLGDPNLAADYFLCGLLVMRAVRRPRRTGWRWLACTLVVIAVVLTLSNGGILALVIATVLGALLALARRRGFAPTFLLATVLAIGGAIAVMTVDVHGWVTRVEESSPLVRDSIGRQAESGGSRTVLAREGVKLWLRGDTTLLGVGPGNTEATLRGRQAPYVKEAHDDYLAALLERGVLGATALLLLIAAVAVRTRRIASPGGIAPPYLTVVPRPELLAAAVVAVAISAMFYEVLHFRHVWALLGLVAALELSGRRRTVPPGSGRLTADSAALRPLAAA